MSVAPPRHWTTICPHKFLNICLLGSRVSIWETLGHVVHCFLPGKFLDCVISLALDVFHVLSSRLGLSFHIKFNLIPLSSIQQPEVGSQWPRIPKLYVFTTGLALSLYNYMVFSLHMNVLLFVWNWESLECRDLLWISSKVHNSMF